MMDFAARAAAQRSRNSREKGSTNPKRVELNGAISNTGSSFLTNDEIAERLVVSPATAKTHVSRAMIKLGARDRAQLVVFAYESGLVRPG